MIRYSSLSRGSTLAELLVAVTILVTAVSSLVALSINNSCTERQATERLVAGQLASEGIEVVRNIRDSNWLAGQPWDSGLVSDGQGIVRFDLMTGQWSFDDNPNTIEQAALYQLGEFYSHQFIISGQTPFSRLLYLDAVCAGDVFPETVSEPFTPGGRTCSNPDEQIGLRVASHVRWTDQGGTFDTWLVDYLYDWR